MSDYELVSVEDVEVPEIDVEDLEADPDPAGALDDHREPGA